VFLRQFTVSLLLVNICHHSRALIYFRYYYYYYCLFGVYLNFERTPGSVSEIVLSIY